MIAALGALAGSKTFPTTGAGYRALPATYGAGPDTAAALLIAAGG